MKFAETSAVADETLARDSECEEVPDLVNRDLPRNILNYISFTYYLHISYIFCCYS